MADAPSAPDTSQRTLPPHSPRPAARAGTQGEPLVFPALIPLAAPLMIPLAVLGLCAVGGKVVHRGEGVV